MAKGSLEIKKGGHTYAIMEMKRENGGRFFMANSSRSNKVKFFDTKADLKRHYTSIKNEIEKAF